MVISGRSTVESIDKQNPAGFIVISYYYVRFSKKS